MYIYTHTYIHTWIFYIYIYIYLSSRVCTYISIYIIYIYIYCLHHISAENTTTTTTHHIRVQNKYRYVYTMIDIYYTNTHIILRSRCICVRKIICAWRVVYDAFGIILVMCIYCDRASKFSCRPSRTIIKIHIIIIIVSCVLEEKKSFFNNRQMCCTYV